MRGMRGGECGRAFTDPSFAVELLLQYCLENAAILHLCSLRMRGFAAGRQGFYSISGHL
jgi:hypothetical protein